MSSEIGNEISLLVTYVGIVKVIFNILHSEKTASFRLSIQYVYILEIRLLPLLHQHYLLYSVQLLSYEASWY